eukprot:5060238-Pyramimonas_sp.AAC.1
MGNPAKCAVTATDPSSEDGWLGACNLEAAALDAASLATWRRPLDMNHPPRPRSRTRPGSSRQLCASAWQGSHGGEALAHEPCRHTS